MPAAPIKARLLNASGEAQPMPDGWKSPMRNSDGTLKSLYQLHVDWKGRGFQPVGPAADINFVSEFRAAVEKEIIAGRERLWTNPSVIQVT